MGQQGVRAMMAARWRAQQLLAGLLVLVLIATLTGAGGAAADEVPTALDPAVEESEAAPAIAERLLADARIRARYGSGRTGGNHIADVARFMGPGTDFDGVAASDTVAYECAVATFLRAGRDGVSADVSQAACATVPNPPQGLEITAGDGQLVIAWQAPDDSDGVCTETCDAPVTSYTVTLDPADAGPFTVTAEDDLSVLADGLTNGTTYTVSVVATNRIGDSDPATGDGTPATVPNPPRQLEITPGDGQLVITWQAPADDDSDGACTETCDAPVTSYTVTVQDGEEDPVLVEEVDADANLSVLAGGLTNGTTYTVSVVATNRIGDSDPATGDGTPATVPNPPRQLEIMPGDSQLIISWEAPEDSHGVCTAECEAPVTSYTVTVQDGEEDPVLVEEVDAGQSLSVLADELTNGTSYTVSVVATNRIGDSDPATGDGTPEAGGLLFTAISAGDAHTCGIADDIAYCWGADGSGQLGNGTDGVDQLLPVGVATDGDSDSALPADKAVTAISAGGNHTCAVADGIAYCWGSGSEGQLGNGDTGNRSRPVRVATDGDSALPDAATVTAISAGFGHTCAVADGIAYCWGRGFDGQLGNGTTDRELLPVRVATDGDSALPDAATVTAISAGSFHTCAVANGAAYCWGSGVTGRLGNGTTDNQSLPVAVATDGGSALPADEAVTAISAGNVHTCAVADGIAYCWGDGFVGRLGNGDTDIQTRPVAVATDGDSALPDGAAVTAISAGIAHTCAVADGIAYCWGFGGVGRLGNGTTGNQLLPVKVATDGDSALPADATVTAISAGIAHTCAVTDDTGYCWGFGLRGRLGNGDTEDQTRPVRVLAPA